MNIFNIFKRVNNIDYEDSVFKEVNANKLNNNIKLLVISDTHGDLAVNKELQNKLLSIKNYDLCCVLGDISDDDYDIIINNIPKEKIVALLGNHDRYGLINEKGVYNLNGKTVQINGLTIGGIEGSNKYKPETFPSYTHEESIKLLNEMPYVDILLSHDKPFTINNNDPVHDGLKGITKYVYDKHIPLVIHGHIHKSYKDKLKNGTIIKSVYKIELIDTKKI